MSLHGSLCRGRRSDTAGQKQHRFNQSFPSQLLIYLDRFGLGKFMEVCVVCHSRVNQTACFGLSTRLDAS
jgi:hypothetical protein